MVGTRVWNHLQLLLPHHQHVIQTNQWCRETGPLAVLHTDVGGEKKKGVRKSAFPML